MEHSKTTHTQGSLWSEKIPYFFHTKVSNFHTKICLKKHADIKFWGIVNNTCRPPVPSFNRLNQRSFVCCSMICWKNCRLTADQHHKMLWHTWSSIHVIFFFIKQSSNKWWHDHNFVHFLMVWFLPLGRWGIVASSICLSVHPISPSRYTWLTSNHWCIFAMPSTCISHYYFGSRTFDLGMVTFTLTLLVTTKLPEQNIPSIPKLYICCILPISQMSSKGSDLDWPLTHFSTSHR